MLRTRFGTQPASTGATIYWPAAFFGLDRTRAFSTATAAQQQAILALCTRAVMEEALFIEKLGMAYASRLAQLAETSECLRAVLAEPLAPPRGDEHGPGAARHYAAAVAFFAAGFFFAAAAAVARFGLAADTRS